MASACCLPGWYAAPQSEANPSGPWRTVPAENPGHSNAILDIRTGQRYRGDSYQPIAIATISAAIFVACPFYMAGIIAWHVAKTAVRVSIAAYQCIESFIQVVRELRPDIPLRSALRTFDAIPKFVAEGFWDVVRSPFHALAMMGAAALGIFCPYEGRKYIGIIENNWHHGVSYRHDIRRQHANDEDMGRFMWNALKDPASQHVLYLAYCCQPLESGISD